MVRPLTPGSQRTIRFLVGTVLVIYESVIYSGSPRWPLIVLYGAMMGLPLGELGDEVRRRIKQDDADA